MKYPMFKRVSLQFSVGDILFTQFDITWKRYKNNFAKCSSSSKTQWWKNHFLYI